MCLCVTEVGYLWGGTGIVTHGRLRTEPRTLQGNVPLFENVGHGLELQADAIGEQQLKWTQSGSSS